MSNETNLALHPTPEDSDEQGLGTEPRAEEALLVVAEHGQVPVQLEHWLRKRQMAVKVSSSNRLDPNEIRQSGARYVLFDMDVPSPADLAQIRSLKSELPQVRLLAMTASSDPRSIESMTEAGVSGVIVKRPYVADLALALQAAAEGKTFVSGVANQKEGSGIQITARERQVLELMANGYSNQAIGEKLSISVKTVEAHRARLFKKLGASNVADAVLLAIRVGLVVP